MANSLELRVPFLDKEVFKVASTLPTKLRVNKYNTKYAMRRAAQRHLPQETAEKEKLGFILCDIDMTESAITPLRLLAAIKHKKEISEIPFYFFSQYSVDKNTTIAANALKVSGIFANYHPVEMTRKIADEIRKKI